MNDGSLEKQVIAFERDQIVAMLEKSQGSVSQAAQRLGLSRAGLYKKIKRHAINPSMFRNR